jgi:homoserine kinase
LACNLYNEFTFEISKGIGLELEVVGEGSDRLRASNRNLTFNAFDLIWTKLGGKQVGLKVKMHNRIPLSRGLGSSSSAIVAGLFGANALKNEALTREELFQHAAELEGHPDNVGPAIFGGINITYMEKGVARALTFRPGRELSFIALVPEKTLSTSLARAALPTQVPHVDAAFNANRAALLVGSLMSGCYDYLGAALEDRLHQPYRAHLIPGMADAFAAARANGAYGAVISGSGSTLMAYADAAADGNKIGQAMQNALAAHGEKSKVHILRLDPIGAQILN